MVIKLKTLKEIVTPFGDEHSEVILTDRNLIRKEAIKWVKELNQISENSSNPDRFEKKLKTYIHRDFVGFADSGYDEYASHPFMNVINWINHFFDIKEGDLK